VEPALLGLASFVALAAAFADAAPDSVPPIAGAPLPVAPEPGPPDCTVPGDGLPVEPAGPALAAALTSLP
jgi:hypothetical protein